jgi:hypothetical protein
MLNTYFEMDIRALELAELEMRLHREARVRAEAASRAPAVPRPGRLTFLRPPWLLVTKARGDAQG